MVHVREITPAGKADKIFLVKYDFPGLSGELQVKANNSYEALEYLQQDVTNAHS